MSDFKASFGDAGSHSEVDLFAGSSEVTTEPVVFSSGADIARYAVVGRITATGECVLCNPAANDGSENPIGIAVEPADSAAADANGNIYVAGDFNIDALVWHAGFTTDAQKKAAFDRTPITLKKVG